MASTTEIERLLVSIVGDSSQYEAALQRAIRATENFRQDAGRAMARLGAMVAAPIVGFGNDAVQSFSKFDQAMTEATAIMTVTEKQIERMRDTALTLSTRGPQGADKLAKAFYYLASAGLNTEQAISTLPVIQRFATAGMFDLERATSLAADAQSALGLRSKNIQENLSNLTHITDVLVGANILANATTEDFSKSITTKFGSALKSVNKDIVEGAAVLAAYADQGIKARLAGETGFRLIRMLGKAATEHKPVHEALGVKVFSDKPGEIGKMRHLADIVQDFEKLLIPMSDELRTTTLAQLGFEARVQASILPLLGASERIREYERRLQGMNDISKEVSEKQLKSFNSQMQIARNNLNLIGIEIGEIVAPALRIMAAALGDVAAWFRNLDPETKRWIVTISAVVATVGSLLVAFSALRIIGGFLAPSVLGFSYMLGTIIGIVPLIGLMRAGLLGVASAARSASAAVTMIDRAYANVVTAIVYTPRMLVGGVVTGFMAVLQAVRWVVGSLKIAVLYSFTWAASLRTAAGWGITLKGIFSGIWSVLSNLPGLLLSIPRLLSLITIPLTLISGLATAAATAVGVLMGAVTLVGVGIAAVLVADWVESVGGLAKAWELVKKKAVEFWEWMRPIRQALRSLFGALWEAGVAVWERLRRYIAGVFGDVVQGANTSWEDVRKGAVTAVIAMEFAVRNYGQVWEFVLAGIKLSVVTFANNFGSIIMAVVKLAISLFGVLVSAIVSLFQSIDWEVLWDGLAGGARAAARAAWDAVVNPFEERKFTGPETDRMKKFLSEQSADKFRKKYAELSPEDRRNTKLVDLLSRQNMQEHDARLATLRRTPARIWEEMKVWKSGKMAADIKADTAPAVAAFQKFGEDMEKIWNEIGDPDKTPPFEKRLREEFNLRKKELGQSFEEFRKQKLQQFLDQDVEEHEALVLKLRLEGALENQEALYKKMEQTGEHLGEGLAAGFGKEIHKLDASLVDSAEGVSRYFEYVRNLEQERSTPARLAMAEEIRLKRMSLELDREMAEAQTRKEIAKAQAEYAKIPVPNVSPEDLKKPGFYEGFKRRDADAVSKGPAGGLPDLAKIVRDQQKMYQRIAEQLPYVVKPQVVEALEDYPPNPKGPVEKLTPQEERELEEQERKRRGPGRPESLPPDFEDFKASLLIELLRGLKTETPRVELPEPDEVFKKAPVRPAEIDWFKLPEAIREPRGGQDRRPVPELLPPPNVEEARNGLPGRDRSDPVNVRVVGEKRDGEVTMITLLGQIRDALFGIAKRPVPEKTPAELGR